MKKKIQHSISSDAGYEQIYKENFKALHRYAYTFVKDSEIAEDMVQSAFVKLYERSAEVEIHTSVTSYLYKAVYHNSLNYLKHQKVKYKHATYVKNKSNKLKNTTEERMKADELQAHIEDAMQELPERCRTVFQLSRFEGLKYREIADKLDISIKTVENQMGKALRIMRNKLSDYLTMLIIVIIHSLW